MNTSIKWTTSQILWRHILLSKLMNIIGVSKPWNEIRPEEHGCHKKLVQWKPEQEVQYVDLASTSDKGTAPHLQPFFLQDISSSNWSLVNTKQEYLYETEWVNKYMNHFEAAARGVYICFPGAHSYILKTGGEGFEWFFWVYNFGLKWFFWVYERHWDFFGSQKKD